MKNLDQFIKECPGGISFDTVKHLEEVFQWIRAVPGDKDANQERYLQMSGWYDVIEYLRAVATCQTSGKFPTNRTGREGASVLDKFKHSPVFKQVMKQL